MKMSSTRARPRALALADTSIRSTFLAPVNRIGACAPATSVLAAVLCLLLLPLLPVPTTAQEAEIVVEVGEEPTASVVPDGEISLPVRVDLSEAGGLDLSALELEISWNPVRLGFRDATPGTTGTVSTDPSDETEGKLVVAASGLDGASASFELLDLSLAAGQIDGPTTVALRLLRAEDASGGDLSANVGARSLRLCVGSIGLFGDATGDDAVDIIDAQQIARFAVGLDVADPQRARNLGDVTGDGAVDIVDAQQIARFAVGISAPERAGSPAPGGCPEPDEADDAAEFLAAYTDFTDDTLAVVPFFSNDPGALDVAAGLDLRIDESTGTLVLEFLGADRTVVEGPLALAPDPDSPAGVHRTIARGVSAFGRDGLTVTARALDGPQGAHVSVLFAEELRTSFLTTASSASGGRFTGAAAVDLDALTERRRAIIEKWEELGADETLTTLERWACLIQLIVDFHVSAGRNGLELVLAVADDLTDVFVPDEDVRTLAMTGPSVLDLSEVIGDPGELSGFKESLREGEGRFRHFSSNLAVTLIAGEWIAGATAAVTGGDVFPETPDELADRETNLRGQEFASELFRLVDRRLAGEETETIDDGFSVKMWILRNMGDPDVASSPQPEILDPPDGSSFEVGETIGFVGKAVDPQEGILTESTGASFAWRSSLDGNLGTGSSVLRDDLSVGDHVITLDATDSDGNTGSASIEITVEAKPDIESFGARQTSRTEVEFTAVVDFSGSVGSLEVEFDYADGESDVVETPEETGDDEFTAIMTHDYGSTGERTPEVTARNTETGESASQSFGIAEATITIEKDGSGTGGVAGEVESTISSIGVACPPDCETKSESFHQSVVPGFNLSMPFTATASDGSVFTGWSGDLSQGEGCDGTGDCTIPINGDRTITATFESETSDGDELAVGLFEFPLRFDELPGPEALYRLYRRPSSSSGGSSGLRTSRLQVEEKQFGTLSGKLPVGFSGENGFILVDLLTDELLLSGITTLGPIGSPAFGVFGLTETPPGPDSPATVVLYGETGFGFYNTELGGTQLGNQPTAFDAFPAGGNPESGYAVGIQEGVVFIGFDEANGDHDIREFGSPADEFEGEPISAWMPDGFDPTVIPALVLARDSDPDNSLESGVYVESRNDDPPARAADVGLDARRIRCAPNGLGAYVCAVTVFGDDQMAFLTWDGTSSLPALVGSVAVGDGPVDLDMRLLPNGSVGVVSTGFNDNTLTVMELDTGGTVVSSDTRSVPEGCLSPAHAVFIRDAASLKVVGTCTDSDNYFVVESGF